MRSGRGKALPPADNGGNAAVLGLTAPTAKAIVGANMKGSVAKTGTCGVCSQVGHDDVECPIAFSQAFPNRSMPGWDEDGVKIGANWSGENITPSCLGQWCKMQSIGFFVKAQGSKRAALPFATN